MTIGTRSGLRSASKKTRRALMPDSSFAAAQAAASLAQSIKEQMAGYQVYPVATQEEVGQLADALWKTADVLLALSRAGIHTNAMHAALGDIADVLGIEQR